MVKSILGRQTDFKSHECINFYYLDKIKTIKDLILITHIAQGMIVTAAEDIDKGQGRKKASVCLERAQTRAIEGS